MLEEPPLTTLRTLAARLNPVGDAWRTQLADEAAYWYARSAAERAPYTGQYVAGLQAHPARAGGHCGSAKRPLGSALKVRCQSPALSPRPYGYELHTSMICSHAARISSDAPRIFRRIPARTSSPANASGANCGCFVCS